MLVCTGQILRYCDPAFFSPGLSETVAAPGAIVNHPLTWEKPPTPSANAVWWRADCTPEALMVQGLCSLATICQSMAYQLFLFQRVWGLTLQTGPCTSSQPVCQVACRAETVVPVAQHPLYCSQVQAGMLAGVT